MVRKIIEEHDDKLMTNQSGAVIRFENVSKRYTLGSFQSNLRESITELLRKSLSFNKRGLQSSQYFWALQDASFEVNRGEALGFVGRNGAGKTTILKLLSKITKPTVGHIEVDGRVAAMIELGAGFHPDLTGRENVYLYGTILGFTRREIDQQFHNIVDFGELEQFMDTPVKRYSSGMYARLAFSVAANTHPDILLVDEVLAVGDSNFQDKCLDFMHSFVGSGNTTVFVSHNLYAVEQLCHRLIWIDQGRILAMGNPSRILEQYMRFMEQEVADNVEKPEMGRKGLQIQQVSVTDAEGRARQVFTSGEDVAISIDYTAEVTIKRPHFCIWVSDSLAPNPLFTANMLLDGEAPEYIEGPGTVQCLFKNVPLMPRGYYVWVEVWGADRSDMLYKWQRLGRFQVVDPKLLDNIDEKRGIVRFAMAHSPVRVPYEWRFRQVEAEYRSEDLSKPRDQLTI